MGLEHIFLVGLVTAGERPFAVAVVELDRMGSMVEQHIVAQRIVVQMDFAEQGPIVEQISVVVRLELVVVRKLAVAIAVAEALVSIVGQLSKLGLVECFSWQRLIYSSQQFGPLV